MTDTVIKPKAAEAASEPVPAIKDQPQHDITHEEVPLLDYESQHGKPYSVDYFNLGDTWNDGVSGFSKEVGLLEEYVKSKIDSGEIANSVNAAREILKGIEKTTNMAKEERNVVRMEVMAAYVEFLMKQDKIKYSLNRYGKSTG